MISIIGWALLTGLHALNLRVWKDEPKTFSNFGGNKNLTNNLLYRFSGFYMPIFYDVHMFYKGSEKRRGNYSFQTTCSPPVTFDKIETPHLPWVNYIPEGEFSHRTFLYDDKFEDPYYNITYSNLQEVYHSPIKQGWDAVLVNYERNSSFYHYSFSF